MAAALPERRAFFRGRPYEFTLNPGPFNVKEHVLITIFANAGAGTVYAIHVVTAVRVFYGKHLTFFVSLSPSSSSSPPSCSASAGPGRYLVHVVAVQPRPGLPLQLPWWGVLLACAIAFFFTLPIGTIKATRNQTPGLNIITDLALEFLQDFKLGHYMKIPPRIMFMAQVVGTLIAAFVYLGTAWWLMDTTGSPTSATSSSSQRTALGRSISRRSRPGRKWILLVNMPARDDLCIDTGVLVGAAQLSAFVSGALDDAGFWRSWPS